MDGTKRALTARLALVGAAGLALAGAMGAGHAEPIAAMPIVEVVKTADTGTTRFTPSADASADQSFVPFSDDAPALAVPGQADTITSIAATGIASAEPEAELLGSGVASFYGRRFAGRPTASGEAFDPQQLTAAHRTLPFGSQVRVTNPRNGKSVVVRINDRGPFHKGRLIDVSRRAAEQLGIVAAGHGKVELALIAG